MMRRLLRYFLKTLTVVSLVLWAPVAALLVWTEAIGRTECFTWGERGVHRCLELSADDADYKVLHDPGLPATPRRWQHLPRGWAAPPRPSNPAALPPGSVTWVMPPPNSDFPPTSHGGVADLGFEHATFAGWYGPGTSLRSYRISYFLVLIPAAVLPGVWMARFTLRFALRWVRYGRFGPGRCRSCGYDLRATPGRCPECGKPVAPALEGAKG
jgi:hypothetical protein